jgi:hypothetical protein
MDIEGVDKWEKFGVIDLASNWLSKKVEKFLSKLTC